MRRRSILAAAMLLSAAVLGWLLWPAADPRFAITFDADKTNRAKAFLQPPVAAIADAPHIVLIVADDLGKHETTIYGDSAVDTPNLKRLAQGGVACTDGYITSPICSPSRAALMTGRYQQRFGFELLVHDRYPRNRLEWYAAKALFSNDHWQAIDELLVPAPMDILKQGIPPSELTLAELLKKHGYATAIFGKWHLGNGPETVPEARGFDYHYGFYDAFSLYQDPDNDDVVNARGTYFADRYQWWKGRHGNCAIRKNGEEINEDVYLTDKIATETIGWIDHHLTHKPLQPFFAYVPFNAPHAPLQAEKKHYDRLAHVDNHERRVYLAMIASLDEHVGRILDTLDARGIADNTLVVFLSDNGGAAYTGASDNAPLKGGKFTNFEGGLNVPLVVRWPRQLPAGLTYSAPTSSLDVFATIARAAGVALPTDRTYDGVDVLPWLRTPADDAQQRALFWRAEGHRAIRLGRYKLISDRTTHARALFDVVADKFETTNILSTQPEIAADLETRLQKWESELVDPAWPRVMEFHFEDDGQPYLFPL